MTPSSLKSIMGCRSDLTSRRHSSFIVMLVLIFTLIMMHGVVENAYAACMIEWMAMIIICVWHGRGLPHLHLSIIGHKSWTSSIDRPILKPNIPCPPCTHTLPCMHAARTPLTARYLEKDTNWTECEWRERRILFPIKIHSHQGSPQTRLRNSDSHHQHKPLPGGCRMGMVTDTGLQQVGRNGRETV